MSVAEAQTRISAREFAEIMAIDRVQPTDEDEWRRAAMIACVIVNANRGKGTRPAKVEDFMPNKFRRPNVQSAEQMMAQLRRLGKRVARKQKG